jgi:hypothetical protein
MTKPSQMDRDEHDTWVTDNTGLVAVDLTNGTIVMTVRETLTRARPSDNWYRLRLYNLTYLTIGTLEEDSLYEYLNGTHENRALTFSRGDSGMAITPDMVKKYGQKKQP